MPPTPELEEWLMEDLPGHVSDWLTERFTELAGMPVPAAFSHGLHEHLRAWSKNKVLSYRLSDHLDLEDGDIRTFVATLAAAMDEAVSR